MTDTDWYTARELAHNAGRSLRSFVEKVRLHEAASRTLALDVFALDRIPSFASAAMDGWVVAGPAPWQVGQPIATGSDVPEPLPSGDARPIGTGGPIPPGSFAVVRREIGHIVGGPGDDPFALTMGPTHPAILDATVTAGADIRWPGEEADVGDVLINEGTSLTPPLLAVAASAGHDELAVRVKPVVDILILGNEVDHSGMSQPGHVRDVFAPALPGAIQRSGGKLGTIRYLGDNRAVTAEGIRQSTADIIIVTGGTSRGEADHSRDALADIGATTIFDGVGMRPGHPTMLARTLTDSIVLCLPGNPLAGILAFASFGPPLISGHLRGPMPEFGSVRLALSHDNKRPGIQLVACTLDQLNARPVNYQGTGMSRGLASADCVIIVPEGGVAQGALVHTLPLPW